MSALSFPCTPLSARLPAKLARRWTVRGNLQVGEMAGQIALMLSLLSTDGNLLARRRTTTAALFNFETMVIGTTASPRRYGVAT